MLAADLTAALLAAPGPHPAPDELRQYAAGALAPAAEQRIEAHALDCDRCADLLAGFAQTDATTTDQALTRLRQRLHQRTDAAPVAVGPRYRWPQLAAAAAVVGALAAGTWGWQHLPTAAEQPVAAAAAAPAGPPQPPAAAAPPEGMLAPAAPTAAATETENAKAEVAAAPPIAASGRTRAARKPQPARPMSDSSFLASSHNTTGLLATADHAIAAAPARQAAPSASQPEMAASAGAETAPPPTPTAAAPASVASLNVASQKALPVAAAPAMADERAAAPRRAEPMPPGPAFAPAPAGGLPAFHEYLRREAAKYEPEPTASRLIGNVRVRFTVGEDGKLRNITVVRALRADYDAEALRLVSEGPRWQPGIAGGRRAALAVEATVPFQK